MKKIIYAGIFAMTILSLQACEAQSERDSDPSKDAAHKRNHRSEYAEKAQDSN